MSPPLQRELVRLASAAYRPAGRWAWHFARGKLGSDPLFAALLSARLHARGDWPAEQPDPPRITTYHGIDKGATVIRAARCGLADSAFPVSLEVGDLRHCALPPADVISLFDVLHYLPATAQEDLLRRVRAHLPAHGRLLLRVGDAAAGLPHHLSRVVDRLVVLAHGGWPHLHCRTADAWQALLRGLGFQVKAHPVGGGGFANVLLSATPAPCQMKTEEAPSGRLRPLSAPPAP